MEEPGSSSTAFPNCWAARGEVAAHDEDHAQVVVDDRVARFELTRPLEDIDGTVELSTLPKRYRQVEEEWDMVRAEGGGFAELLGGIRKASRVQQ